MLHTMLETSEWRFRCEVMGLKWTLFLPAYFSLEMKYVNIIRWVLIILVKSKLSHFPHIFGAHGNILFIYQSEDYCVHLLVI